MKTKPHSAALALTITLFALLGATSYAESTDTSDKLTEAAKEHRYRLDFDGERFSGPALEQLLTAARDSQFLLIGEEHGIAENPMLVAQMFTTLVDDGYEKLTIEISPPMAAILDAAAKEGGIEGIRSLFATPGGEPAFFGMQEEAELIAAVRSALPDADEVLWGVDYEVSSDRPLLRKLQNMQRPPATDEPLNTLIATSDASWAKYVETGSPQYIFSFAAEPAIVGAVRDAWPEPDESATQILDTLQTTLAINQAWMQGRGWDSNAQRAAYLRANFIDHWNRAKANGSTPKVLVKLGSNHIVRGRNYTGTFDIGTLVPEIAAIEDTKSVSVLVLPGKGSLTAVLNPSTWTFEAKPAKDNYADGIDVLTDAVHEDAFTLIDMTALRPIVGSSTEKYGVGVARVVHGFDFLLVMSGSTAASEFEHE